ncbi:DUF1801 domain-containing protein [Leptospira idonii]|uniref:DUF1801 domain-containing protein n=1 Tax=Leptospira idonii TaxID=1193500 RepID=A0A4R9LY19_9LEPT|nr:DUF1801 domain-containing protein [Leptospira idonii]TGN18227.1 DUF1801 domain-containing protein [Leptospira idonii]
MKKKSSGKTARKIRFGSESVAEVFAEYPDLIREKLLDLRDLILETAEETGVGRIEETLKWGEPSYLTQETKLGSTVRIHHKPVMGEEYAMYFICQTDLVSRFRSKYPKVFRFGGNRSIHFTIGEKVPVKELKDCIAMALTYHKT